MKLLKFTRAIEYIKKYLLEDLHLLEISSAQLYGSITFDNVFVYGVSDIDICVFTNKMSTMTMDQIVKIILDTKIDFKDKYPTILRDHITGKDRIEFYLNHPDVTFDITILPVEFPVSGDFINTASYDSLEVIIGALYQHGYSLFGEIPCLNIVKDKFMPFYDNKLRLKRLQIIGKRLFNYNKRLEEMILKKDCNLLDHLYKSRTYFLKWLFIYFRKYPVNLQKHTYYQLTEILNLDEKDKKGILMVNNCNIFESAANYLNIVKKYFDAFSKERK